jgi:threonine dehydrogenase-like Zn-dependent dehydrogenase
MSAAVNPTVVFPEAGRVEVEERRVPSPGVGEVLIRSRVSLVSPGTEMTVLDGGPEIGEVWRSLRRFPYVAGYSNVGEVIAVGGGVDPAWLGRRVDSHTPHAAYTVCAAAELRRVPDGVSDEAAALATLAEVVMNGLRRSRLTWGESVAVVGLGLLGQLAARFARLAGARRIHALDLAEPRLARLPAGPAFVPLQGTPDELRPAIGEEGVDLVVECTGNPRAIPGQLRLLRPQGRFLLVSSPGGPCELDFHDLCNRSSLTLIGAHYFSHPPQASFDDPWTAKRHGELFLDWLASGDLSVDELVTHRFPGPQAPEAYALLRERRLETLGVVFDWRAS